MRTDTELVNASLNGEKQAFEVLVKRYERVVRAIALNVLGDYHCANDVTQEAFVTAFEKLPGLRKAESFGPWVMKITRRRALSMACQRRVETTVDSPITSAAESRNGELDEDKHRLLAAVLRLPESEKQVIMLRYFARHSVRDVADIVGRSVGTVTKQLSRAHKRLRKILERPEK